MSEVYAIFTTGNDYYDRPELFGLYATVEKAEAEAAVLRERLGEADCSSYEGGLLYSRVSVTYVPIRY